MARRSKSKIDKYREIGRQLAEARGKQPRKDPFKDFLEFLELVRSRPQRSLNSLLRLPPGTLPSPVTGRAMVIAKMHRPKGR